jgi:hypothetical protein
VLAAEGLVGDIDVLDVRAPGAVAAELDQRFDRVWLTLEDGFDGAVRPVQHPPADASRAGPLIDGRPEADALDHAANDDVPANQPATDSSTASGMSKFA